MRDNKVENKMKASENIHPGINQQSNNNSQPQEPATNQTQAPSLTKNNSSSTAQPHQIGSSSSILAIIGLVLGGVSIIPLLGFLSIFSIIVSIGSFVRKESKLMSFLALLLGLLGLATSPLIWGPILLYMNYNLHGFGNSGNWLLNQSATNIQAPLNPKIFKLQDTTYTQARSVNYYLFIIPSSTSYLPQTINPDKVAFAICNQLETYSRCTVYFWDSPDMVNFAYAGVMPEYLKNNAVWKTTCNGSCINYRSGGTWRPNHLYLNFPEQAIVRKEIEPGFQYIGGEFKDSIKKTIYLSYANKAEINNILPLSDLENYATSQFSKDSEIEFIYFYTNAQDAKQHSSNYAYICSPFAGSAICSASS